MTAKKGSVMSIVLDPEVQDRIKSVAKRRNISVSKLVRDIVDKSLPKDQESFDTVILKVPPEAKVDAVTLRNWMGLRVDAVVKALTAP